MKPMILESASATSSSLFLTALRTDFDRPELGFQSNHSERRSSTPRASVINALLTTSPFNMPHRGPSRREDEFWERIKPPGQSICKSELKHKIPSLTPRDA